MKIAERIVGRGVPPFVVAELSGNHNQSLHRALEIVEAAARAGAHALKIQTYTAATMTLDLDEGDFRISDPGGPWNGMSLHELYQKACTPWEWHEPIFARAKALGMIAFSTPFDETAVDFLERLDVPCYKIASFENVDLALIRRVAATGKPLMISTGMATLGELDDAIRAAREAGGKDPILLKCTSAYPADPKDANIATLAHLRETFGCEIGLSDHTPGIGVAVASVALGASVIEKHLTLRRADGGVDASFSMEPREMAQLVAESRRAWQALGGVAYGPTEAERNSFAFRRSLYFARDLAAGDVVAPGDVRSIRPGGGLPPKHRDAVIGMRVRCAVSRGTPVRWDLLG